MSPPIGFDMCEQIAQAERELKFWRRVRDAIGLIVCALVLYLAYGYLGDNPWN